MRANVGLGSAVLLDAIYLMAFVAVPEWPWLSYGLLAGLASGAVAAGRWWRKPSLDGWQVVLLAGSLIVPFTSWALSRRSNAPAAKDAEVQPRTIHRRDTRQRLGMLILLGLVLTASASGFAERRILGPALASVEASAVTTLNRSLGLAAASYGSARLIDRGIALAAEAELTLPFIGGVAVKPGQVFKPLQDMAERYSDVMVVAMASIGIQRVLLDLGHNAAVTVLGSLGALLLMTALVFPEVSRRLARVTRAVVVLLLVARLAIPLVVMGVGLVSDVVLEERRRQAQQALDVATAELQEADAATLEEGGNGLTNWLNDLRESTSDLTLGVRRFSDDMVDRFVQLLVVYLLETLLMPLAMLAGLWHLLRMLIAPSTARMTVEERDPARLS
ncbi:hypothetical protein SAMN02745148_00473 [Modicisalibacter ilicicola DSM 19980]|uniref:Uncharacterized protein n=1 Tax=Modicisalibacter ilicicola DSM 19980 TaxID=1121942 RepID=A0A1M4TJW1_9GAMM|nr:hypothetical protein [Halomonas ilicicola]SHE44750.1 hypothetical protein SAMN02745148_00473 [Halomonas ilicicola DSM 19980]